MKAVKGQERKILIESEFDVTLNHNEISEWDSGISVNYVNIREGNSEKNWFRLIARPIKPINKSKKGELR